MFQRILIVILMCFLVMGASNDLRYAGGMYPVARYEFTTLTWDTGDGHDAQTASLNINGTILRQDVIITSVTANPTVTISATNQNSITLGELGHTALADGTSYTYDSSSSKGTPDADFNPVTVNDTITISVDPSADAGGSGQTLSVTVIFYVR